MTTHRWQFWIDRGGTFTDIVARRPDGEILLHKLLSENPDRYADAPVQGIRDLLGVAANAPLPVEQIELIKMGTTVATNALLERQGEPTLLVITQGFGDALRIGYQNRPQIFAQQIQLPEMLYSRVLEIKERLSATGEILQPLDIPSTRQGLADAFTEGWRACAIVCMHGYRYPEHEQQVAAMAQEIGFTQISVSHQVSPLIKLVSRGDTTVVDAYLSPVLRRYVEQVQAQLLAGQAQGQPQRQLLASSPPQLPQLMFMQSNGGLTAASQFQGKDSLLSGPAGGIVGAVQTSLAAGYNKIIGFDMGGTSTDVSHYDGGNLSKGGIPLYERVFETEVAGVRLRAPMLAIHTVAAGGGSIIQFDGARYRVGPASAGAYPGPACYRQGGPLTITDCNMLVGKLQPQYFPTVFGPDGTLPLDKETVSTKFQKLTDEINQVTGQTSTPAQVAQGFLEIAIEKMANAIKKISLQRGYDLSEYTLCCFGGAGGQHACLIAEALGMPRVLIHPYAGVLSAYGMGLADLRVVRQQMVEAPLTPELLPSLQLWLKQLASAAQVELAEQLTQETTPQILRQVQLRYQGSDTPLLVDFGELEEMQAQILQMHLQQYGFAINLAERPLVVDSLMVEAVAISSNPPPKSPNQMLPRLQREVGLESVDIFSQNQWWSAQVFERSQLQPHTQILGPALIIETTGTTVIEPGWQAQVMPQLELVLTRQPEISILNAMAPATTKDWQHPDPIKLEIFNHLFQAIAEQMGVTLQQTSSSVNIKERLDFSCAIFDGNGELVANAPHIPVHLGSMGESVQALIQAKGKQFKPGDVFALNNPYQGGTHLPDVTVITPVFLPEATKPNFYVAARGHHADIGGLTPGSMPPFSTHLDQEGILIKHFSLVRQGQFQRQEFLELLTNSPYPARNPQQNLADIQAQIAANQTGAKELVALVKKYGQAMVSAYMQHVQDNAAKAVQGAIAQLQDGQFCYPLDDGSQIQVKITINHQQETATIDFTGTSEQQANNFNAPLAICKAAVLYVFRTLVADEIPLNAGCLRPLTLIIPAGSLLNPCYPAAVVAGNVETSQVITDALYGALGVMAAAQGTMNNLTFGNQTYQYYETIGGGSGAGPSFPGTDAVQTHMTNSRLTDPEVLEWRYPILIDAFARRPDSGGQGKHRGGNGILRRIRFRQAMTATILSNHRLVPPFGLAGGQPGSVGRNWVERADGQIEPLAGRAEVAMQPGDVFVIETPGGGGYGLAEDTP